MLMVEIKSLDEINSLPKTRWNISQPADNDVHEDALITGTLLMEPTYYLTCSLNNTTFLFGVQVV